MPNAVLREPSEYDEHLQVLRLRRRARRYRRALRLCRAQLAQARERRVAAEAALAERDWALATVCHDLRTPLNAILGWAQLARADADGVDEALTAIERGARDQAMLIDGILDLARSAGGTLRLARSVVDVRSVVGAALASVKPMAASRGVYVRSSTSADPALVLGDAARLQQVAWNLLTNAIKFTPRGGVVTVETDADDASVRMVVRDTGCGIDPSFLPRIFDRFEQASSTPADRHAVGAGIGLAIVRRLVEAHGGSVEAASGGRGAGATFTVSLPRLRGAAASAAAATAGKGAH